MTQLNIQSLLFYSIFQGKGVMTTYWLEGILDEHISTEHSSKLLHYSHLQADPEQEIEDNDSSEEENVQETLPNLKLGPFQGVRSTLPSADMIELSIKTPSLHLFDDDDVLN